MEVVEVGQEFVKGFSSRYQDTFRRKNRRAGKALFRKSENREMNLPAKEVFVFRE